MGVMWGRHVRGILRPYLRLTLISIRRRHNLASVDETPTLVTKGRQRTEDAGEQDRSHGCEGRCG